MSQVANRLTLSAQLIDLEPLRYTPSGVPALNCKLEHASDIEEAGHGRQVKALVRSVAFGSIAERLTKQSMGTHLVFEGFLATPRGSKQLVFHIQEFVTE